MIDPKVTVAGRWATSSRCAITASQAATLPCRADSAKESDVTTCQLARLGAMTSMPRRSLFPLYAALAALVAPAAASADAVVTELTRDTPIAAYGGVVAWSGYDAATGRYRLVIRRGDQAAPVPIADSRRAFDVSLGPDARGRVVALYTRCRTPNHGCDVYRYDVGARSERKVAAVSSTTRDEAWPVQWGDRLAGRFSMTANPARSASLTTVRSGRRRARIMALRRAATSSSSVSVVLMH